MDDEAADNLWVRNRRQTKVGYGVCACCRLPDKVGETFFRQLGVVSHLQAQVLTRDLNNQSIFDETTQKHTSNPRHTSVAPQPSGGTEKSHEIQQREKQRPAPLHLQRNNSLHLYVPHANRLESSLVKKSLWVLADNKGNIRPRPMCPHGTEGQQPLGLC